MLRRRFVGDDALAGLPLVGVRGRPAAKSDSTPAAKPVARPQSAPRTPRIDKPSPTLTGRVNVSPRGFAFVTTIESKSYYIRPEKARRLLSGDVIEFKAKTDAPDDALEVRDIRSMKRREQFLMCAVTQLAELTYLVPDDPCFTPVQLSPEPPAGSYAPGDVIAVRLAAYEGRVLALTEPGSPLRGEFAANLGTRDREGFDLEYARLKHGFHEDLPPELELLADSFEDPSSHAPTDRTPYVTIDGESTRDFDDEVYAEPLPQGGWLVKVGVADVARYVTPGSALDAWASRRGTSVYLPGKTLPMLPEYLSTDRCSLVPGVARHAVVMTLELDAQGNVLSRRIARELTESAARLTYTEVASFLHGSAGAQRYSAAVEANLQSLHGVYKVLAERREAEGRVEFEDPEPTAKFRDGRLVVEWEVRNDAHKLIEELMCLANTEAAGMLVERYGVGVFRHQPAPSAESWGLLTKWAREQGHELPAEPSLKAMSDLVMAMPEGDRRHEAVFRTRSNRPPARYVLMTSEQLKQYGGHFSLAKPWYTQFTSPIRRYSDLLVHRLLLAPEGHRLGAEELKALAAAVEDCSDRSQASRQAERLVWDRLKLNGFLGEFDKSTTVSARVVRATSRGFRVVLSSWQVAAWLPGADLREAGIVKGADDQWRRGEGPDATTVAEGAQLQVRWTDVNLERPAYPELLVTIPAA